MDEEQEKIAALSHIINEINSVSEVYPDIAMVFLGIAKTSSSVALSAIGEPARFPVGSYFHAETPQEMDSLNKVFHECYISYMEHKGVEAKDQILYEAEESFEAN